MKFFRILATLIIAAFIGAVVYSFFAAENFEKKIQLVEQQANAQYLTWTKENNCLANPMPCAAYSKTISDWKFQFEQYKEAKNQTPKFQIYNNVHQFFNAADEKYFSFAYLNGRASLMAFVLIGAFILLFILIIFSNKKKSAKAALPLSSKNSNISITPKARPTPKNPPAQPSESEDVIKGLDALLEEDELQSEPLPEPQKEQPAPQESKEPQEEPLTQEDEELLKAIDSLSAADNPQVAIEHLENALTGNLSENLRLQALLLCGSLRIKNKIDETKGREQLNEILRVATEGSVAEKAKKILSL